MQSRQLLSDSSLISPHHDIDKYNNRPPIKKIPEEIDIVFNSGGKNMDFGATKKLSSVVPPKDYKTSIFFTGFHHKAYVDNVQMAQSKTKSNYRSRSASPPLPAIPYTKKSQPKINPRQKLLRDFPQAHNTPEITVKQIFPPNRVLVSRSTSPINIQTIVEEVPSKETTPTIKEEEIIFHLDQLQEENNTIRKDEAIVTPSKILKHFQFKHTKEIPKDIPEKLLNRSQRSLHFDQAFREIVQNGNGTKFDPDSQNGKEEEFVKVVGQRSRFINKTFQKKNDDKSEEESGNKDVSRKISCCHCKYINKHLDLELEESSRINGGEGNLNDTTKRVQLLDQGRVTRSVDAFYKKVHQKDFDLKKKSISEEILHENDLPNKMEESKSAQEELQTLPLAKKSSQKLTEEDLQENTRRLHLYNQNQNEISKVLYCNYGRCLNIATKFPDNNLEEAFPEEILTKNKLCHIPNLAQAKRNHNNRRYRFQNHDLETWKYYQHTSAHMLNNSNNVLEAHRRVSSTSMSFNSPKRPSSVPPLKRQPKKYQNPREIELINLEDKPFKSNQRKRTLIESIKSKVLPGLPTKEFRSWDDDHLKFPKETKNAVMMMLSGAKSKVSWKTEERQHQEGLRQVQSAKSFCSIKKANRTQLPCSKNLLCEKGFHTGKCRKSERGVIAMKYPKPCLCKEKRFWCSECQNVWPGSAKRCEETSSEELEPENAFLQIMEPNWPTKMDKRNFYQQDLVCNFRRKTDQ